MKKYHLYLWLVALVGLMTSCSQDETDALQTANESNRVTLTASLPDDFAQIGTRALPSANGHQLRCILEVWTRDAPHVLKYRKEETNLSGDNVVFDFKIEKGTYDCLFWADFINNPNAGHATIGGVDCSHFPDIYYTTNTDNGLKAISIINSKYADGFNTDVRDAFFGYYKLEKEAAAVTDPSIAPLTRPFAKLTIKEKDATNYGYCSGLTATYQVPTTFNVLDGTVGNTMAEVTCSSKSTDSQTLFSDYIFTDASSTLGSIALTFTGENKTFESVTIPAGIPLQRNYKTNATGSLISEKPAPTDGVKLTVTMDGIWTGTDEEIISAKVGDYFYADGTWGTAYINNALNPCIGIVFEVDADGKSGKIVSLDEKAQAVWATSGTTYATTATGADNVADGTANMATIKALDDDYSDFPAFQWCANRTEGGLTWYLPAPNELQDLYAATCGLKIVDANPQAGEVVRWNISGSGNYMQTYNNYSTQRAAFKEKIIAAGGAEFSESSYISSCESNERRFTKTQCSGMGACSAEQKTSSFPARAIAIFPKP